ncbi:Hypothetical predicted protein, partial [Lynx pardinus]
EQLWGPRALSHSKHSTLLLFEADGPQLNAPGNARLREGRKGEIRTFFLYLLFFKCLLLKSSYAKVGWPSWGGVFGHRLR